MLTLKPRLAVSSTLTSHVPTRLREADSCLLLLAELL